MQNYDKWNTRVDLSCQQTNCSEFPRGSTQNHSTHDSVKGEK